MVIRNSSVSTKRLILTLLSIGNLAISIFAAYVLSAFYLDRIINSYTENIVAFILLRIWIGIMIYIFLDGLFIKKIFTIRRKKIFLLAYLLFISMFIFKPTTYRAMNFDITNIFNDFGKSNMSLILFLGNIVLFVFLGILIGNIFRKKSKQLMLMFIVTITLVEVAQYVCMLGIFDINDIILNTIGFYLGLQSERLLIRRRDV